MLLSVHKLTAQWAKTTRLCSDISRIVRVKQGLEALKAMERQECS